uniref:mevalonate kinase n=1 Tax=Oryza brachyantha TaxID=4533 RepID=J3KZQ8_ORYBR
MASLHCSAAAAFSSPPARLRCPPPRGLVGMTLTAAPSGNSHHPAWPTASDDEQEEQDALQQLQREQEGDHQWRLAPPVPQAKSSSPAGAAAVELDLRDPGLAFSWPCARLHEALLTEAAAGAQDPRSCSPDRLAAITRLLEEQEIPEAKIWLSAGLSAFLFLYTSILGCRPGKVTMSSDLPMGSGLGSSAAFCVSMSGALLVAAGAVAGAVGDGKGTEWELVGKDDLELVNRWAFQGEKIIHGKPSGIDNSVSTFGSMIKFKKGELTSLKSSNPIKMLITDTRVGRNTKALVAGVSERTSRHPDAMASVFHAVNSISEELSSIVELAANDEIAITSKEKKLAELMEMNQAFAYLKFR